MAAIKLCVQERPDFGLTGRYVEDVWEVCKWDMYINATKKQQDRWKERTGVKYEYKMDFTIFDNIHIREEFKYCAFLIIESNKSNVASLGEVYTRLKRISKYYNSKTYSSITETDFDDYISYLVDNGYAQKTQGGNVALVNRNEFTKTERTNRYITTLHTYVEQINAFYENNSEDGLIDEYDKDIWKAHNLTITDSHIDSNRSMNFSDIHNLEFKNHLKAFAKNRLTAITFTSVNSYVTSIKIFYKWLDENKAEIIHLEQLSRNDMEEYFIWLRTQSGYSQYQININILNLKVFFEYGILLELDNFPQFSLILNTDYAIKTKKQANPFTDEELKSIIKLIPKLKPIYGKILYCSFTTGCRLSEILYLTPEQIKQYPDGKYYLLLYQFKTHAEYEKSIPDSTAKIILNQINLNTKKYKEKQKYIFISDRNNVVTQSALHKAVNLALVKYQVKDRNGNILHCNSHRFRSTLATNLLNSGYDVETTGKLLGQKNLKSLGYYANVTNEQTKEQLAPRIEKDELLISNIGKIDAQVLSDYNNPIQLCNGWCTRSVTMGQCAKANHCLECNMFIPTFAHLSMYEMQLRQVEASIAVAEANGMDLIVQKNMKTKVALQNIIAKIRERRTANE